MDPIGAFIRIAGGRSPRLAAQLSWMRGRQQGDVSLRMVEAFVGGGDVVVDVGAHVGLYTWRLAQLVGPRGHVHVFEPNPASQRNLEAIRARRWNVTIHPVALSDRTGDAELHVPIFEDRRISVSVGKRIRALVSRSMPRASYRPVSALGRLSVPRGHADLSYEAIPVRVERLDALLPADGRPITFVKCDVEGHELAVLRGADAVLRRSQPTLLIEIEQRHQDGMDIQQTFNYLHGLGYLGYSLRADGLRPLEEFDVLRDQLAFIGADFTSSVVPRGYINNFLFVRSGTDVARLLASGWAVAYSGP